jgi:hypothetical protein
MAGFQLTLHGRIWVIPEAISRSRRVIRFSKADEAGTLCGVRNVLAALDVKYDPPLATVCTAATSSRSASDFRT